jgi:hypothetical protein
MIIWSNIIIKYDRHNKIDSNYSFCYIMGKRKSDGHETKRAIGSHLPCLQNYYKSDRISSYIYKMSFRLEPHWIIVVVPVRLVS